MEKVIRGSTQETFYRADCRLWYNKDETKLLKDGDREADHLYVGPGDLVPAAVAIEMGLVDGKAVKTAPADGPFPYATGGGWYLLSNNERIKGKGKAKEAEEALGDPPKDEAPEGDPPEGEETKDEAPEAE